MEINQCNLTIPAEHQSEAPDTLNVCESKIPKSAFSQMCESKKTSKIPKVAICETSAKCKLRLECKPNFEYNADTGDICEMVNSDPKIICVPKAFSFPKVSTDIHTYISSKSSHNTIIRTPKQTSSNKSNCYQASSGTCCETIGNCKEECESTFSSPTLETKRSQYHCPQACSLHKRKCSEKNVVENKRPQCYCGETYRVKKQEKRKEKKVRCLCGINETNQTSIENCLCGSQSSKNRNSLNVANRNLAQEHSRCSHNSKESMIN